MSADLPLRDLCDIAVDAAREAGQFIQSMASKNPERKFKDAGSSEASQLVTEVDIRSEAIIRDRLKRTSEQWGIAFVGEESSSGKNDNTLDRLTAPYFWCVDPLDGTLPFVEGRSGYAVSIALLAQSGAPLIGVVYDPAESTLVYAFEGGGVYREPSPSATGKSKTDSLMVLADASFKVHKKYDESVKALNSCALSHGLNGVTWVYGNGAVKNAWQVLEHSAACYIKLPKEDEGGGSIWDYAATACIVCEAGGWVSNIYGNPLELNRSDSTFMNHQGVLYASNEQIARYLIEAL